MLVPGIIYVDTALEGHLEQQAIDQVANVATLPGIVGVSMAMPDIHTGYGFPIGGVAAFGVDDGLISPGGVGYDINCGVRLIRSNLTRGEAIGRIRDLVGALYNNVPSGVGSKGNIALSLDDERQLIKKGARWAVEQGYGDADDLDKTESGGCIEGADPSAISDKALQRGKNQQGTLGSGNHFLEIQYVSEIFDEAAANAFGLFKGQITVMIHTGSRGLGHQVCTDYLATMEKASAKYGIRLYDKELAAAPFKSPEAELYFAAMKGAANYAWANRQFIMHRTMEAFQKVLGASPGELGLSLVYDVAHNIAKVEHHTAGGKKTALVVHRKGATRAFAKGHPELPESYKHIGQPVLIPGDMGRASYVLTGTETAMAETFGSTCHGAGRLMSRHKAIKAAKGRAIWRELEDEGITVMTAGKTTLAEEMPEAYKDVSNVVEIVHNAGISKKVAMLKPLGVVKG
ncbi:RtcB family protein [Candidatus Magnetominusculus dajiuhuensis]|uniref:RtcB family protein n=1 Tax=Candidatus Magnetominusculus dajiuhuensis TaxID=3137712 RepID=UPI003B436C20